jgi:hypothetical protein
MRPISRYAIVPTGRDRTALTQVPSRVCVLDPRPNIVLRVASMQGQFVAISNANKGREEHEQKRLPSTNARRPFFIPRTSPTSCLQIPLQHSKISTLYSTTPYSAASYSPSPRNHIVRATSKVRRPEPNQLTQRKADGRRRATRGRRG